METFEIGSYVSGKTDTDMKAIATAWPNLERLGFFPYPISLDLATNRPQVTLFGMHELLISCLHLQFLRICLDADKITETNDVKKLPEQREFCFSPGSSLIQRGE